MPMGKEEKRMSDLISRQATYDTLTEYYHHRTDVQHEALRDALNRVPSAQPEWNNHIVACLLAELFDDPCACNYNGIDEWLPEKCEVVDACPNPVGVACWEQFLKHKAERRSE